MSRDPARRFFVALIFATMVLVAVVVRPLGGALFVAAVLAGVLAPLHTRLAAAMGGRRAWAAAALVFAAIVVFVGPLVALAAFLLGEGNAALAFVSELARGERVAWLLTKLPDSLATVASEGIARLGDVNRMVESQVGAGGGAVAASIWAALAATGAMTFGAAMTFIALYFLLVHGGELVSWLDRVLPLRPGHTHELLAEFEKISYSVIVATVVTAGVQALAALIGYVIARVPHPVFFAALTFLMAFVPAIGAASVCLLAAAILWATGHSTASLFLALWGLFVVGLVDNVVKPLLIQAEMKISSAVVFFSLIGGLRALGLIGLVVGPLSIALFLALLRIYVRDFKVQSEVARVAAEPSSLRPAV